MPVVHAEEPNERPENLTMGLLIWSIILLSWLLIGVLLTSVPTSGLLRLGLFVVLANATLPVASYVMRWLGVTGSERSSARSTH